MNSMTNEELTSRVVSLEEHGARHAEQIKTLFNSVADLKQITNSVYDLAASCKSLANDQRGMKDTLDKLSADVEEMRERPARRWDDVVTKGLNVVIAAILTWLLVKMGIG